MSYKASVLYDYPIAYYPLDDLTTVDLVSNFTDFLAQFSSYQDVLDNVSSYANIYGDILYDHSGCENDGLYIGDPDPNIVPLVAGNSRATKVTSLTSLQFNITKDYTANTTTSKFGTISSSDNDFTIEFWFYPSISSTEEIPIVADPANEVGVFYEKGNITFKVNSEYVSYTLPYVNKSFHIAAIYDPNYIHLYIDGNLVAYKTLTNFEFSNSTLSLISGPTPTSSSFFLINSLAVYRYSLSQNSIQYHIQEAKSLPAINVAGPENGEVFAIYDNDLTTSYKYSYPVDKSWLELIEDGVTYFTDGNYLQTTYTDSPTSSTVVLEDFILIPSSLNIDASKIEWHGDNGVTVEISSDGITYVNCINGKQIPGYTLTSFGSLSGLYLKITFSSTNTSKFLPKLYSLSLSFYNNQRLYAENGNSYITTLEGDNAVSNYDITFGPEVKDILSRDGRNGLRTVVDSGFHITTDNSVNTAEFFYTPELLTDSGLISTFATNGYAASTYRWNNSGVISKTNIAGIYVNGVNKTSETNISNVFKVKELHHVLIIFSSAVSDEIRFNYSLYGSVPALYQNIALYPDQFTNTQATNHYDYYRRRSSLSTTDTTALSMTENSTSVYNNDWVVIQTV